MSRPDPEILLSHECDDDPKILQVCESYGMGLYVVLYRGRPFQLRRKLNKEVSYPGWKYLRTSFAGSAAHAIRLAEKLNAIYNTTEFTVGEMVPGRTISMN